MSEQSENLALINAQIHTIYSPQTVAEHFAKVFNLQKLVLLFQVNLRHSGRFEVFLFYVLAFEVIIDGIVFSLKNELFG